MATPRLLQAGVAQSVRRIPSHLMKTMQDENRRLKKMFAELSMQNELLKEALGKK
jgi:hypothetical protein